MAKQISQDMFDTVVKENIADFGMEAAEGVSDAVEQFEAQGVDLSNIVKDLSLFSAATDGAQTDNRHHVVVAVESLSKVLDTDPLDTPTLLQCCSVIQKECDLDLAHRCLAGSHQAFPALVRVATACQADNTPLQASLQALCSLCNGQPDLLTDDSKGLLMSLLRTQTDVDVVLLVVRLIRFTCVKHEGNRQGYIAEGLILALTDALVSHRSHKDVVTEVCIALRVLTLDDDIRVAFGKSHDHAKMIVTEAGALGKIMGICQDYMSEKSVLAELFSTLACLSVRNEFCQEILDLGGLHLMMKTLHTNMASPGLTKQVLLVLKAIAGNDEVKVAIVKEGGLQLILMAVSKHIKHAGICEMGCAAVATIILRNPAHCQTAMDANAADILVKVLQLHPDHEMVQKQACMAVRNLVARTRDYCQLFLEGDVERLIQRAYATHPNCRDEAKSALRDLGCKVELKELWTGEGKGIQH